jgi:plasmid maintenance system antidote protein VapI
MDIKAVLDKVAPTSAEQARALGVSDGHIADLKSKRRTLSLPLAARIEELTRQKGLVAGIVAEKTKPSAQDAA